MLRIAFLFVPFLLLLGIASAAPAQGRGERCENNNRNSAGRSVARGLLGGLARSTLGRVGGAAVVAIPMTDMLSDALIDMLDCREQAKAAEATEEAVQRGEVGATANWQSETRPGVTGSSTVTAVAGDCMTVTDIVIVDGEETRAPKQMCRRPPSTRYVRV